MISTTRRVEMVKQLRTEGYNHVVIETNGELNAEERLQRGIFHLHDIIICDII